MSNKHTYPQLMLQDTHSSSNIQFENVRLGVCTNVNLPINILFLRSCCRFGRPEILEFVLQKSDVEAMLKTTTDRWLGGHSAAKAASNFEPGSKGRLVHEASITAWIERMEELICEKERRTPNVMGAYGLGCKFFEQDALDIMTQVKFNINIYLHREASKL